MDQSSQTQAQAQPPPPPASGPIPIAQQPRAIRYYIGPRGLIFFLLAILVLISGTIGYLEYDRLVEPYIEFYICCLPAGIIAGILLFFGFATRVTTVRRVTVQKPADKIRGERLNGVDNREGSAKIGGDRGFEPGFRPDSGMRKFQPKDISYTELLAQKRSLEQFMKNLDEQHRDNLITRDVYLNLKLKYRRELKGLKARIKSESMESGKKVRKLKTKDSEKK